MPRRRKDRPLGPGDHQAIVDHIRSRLPPGYRILILGNTALQIRRVRSTATIDVDVFLVQPGPAIPPWADLVRIALTIDPSAEPSADQASVLLRVPTAAGPAEVDLIRGRRRPGRFVTHDFLTAVADDAVPWGSDLLPRDEALVVMKAWAAVDQQRRAEGGEDAARRAGKRDRFLSDLGWLRDAKLASQASFDQGRLQTYLARVRPSTTRKLVTRLLVQEGVLIPPP